LNYSAGSCDQVLPREVVTHPMVGGGSSFSPDFDPVSPRIVRYALPEPNETRQPDRQQLCPGAHISLGSQQPAGRERVLLRVPGVSLPLYVLHRNALEGR
jgi:hypothetical protein